MRYCPTGSSVKTGPRVQCELVTSDGCVIRLNAETEISVKSANTIEVKRGQIWCRAQDKVPVRVIAPAVTASPRQPPVSPWSAACPTQSCMTTTVLQYGAVTGLPASTMDEAPNYGAKAWRNAVPRSTPGDAGGRSMTSAILIHSKPDGERELREVARFGNK